MFNVRDVKNGTVVCRPSKSMYVTSKMQRSCRPSMFNVRDVRDSTFVSSLDVRARDVLQLVVKRRPMVQRSC